MLTAYINAALRRARYQILPDDEGFFGEIPGLEGVWANAATLEDCCAELRDVLEEWIVLGLRMGHPIPALDGIELSVVSELTGVERSPRGRSARDRRPG